MFPVFIQRIRELPPRVRPASYQPLAGSTLVGSIYLVAVRLDCSAIATDQSSRCLSAARTHAIVEVHVTAYGIPYRPDVSLDGTALLIVDDRQCAFIHLDVVRGHYPLA